MDDVLFYIPTRGVAEERLMGAVGEVGVDVNMRVIRDTVSLKRRLVPRGPKTVAVVVLALTKQELFDLIPLKELLLDFRVLIILPDSDNVTMAAGWGMWPRFVSYADGDFRDVAGVLQKIAGTPVRPAKDAPAVPARESKPAGADTFVSL